MELLLTMTILLVLIVLVGDLILMTNKTSEESAKATHEPMKYLLPQIQLAIGYIDEVPPRARLPNVR